MKIIVYVIAPITSCKINNIESTNNVMFYVIKISTLYIFDECEFELKYASCRENNTFMHELKRKTFELKQNKMPYKKFQTNILINFVATIVSNFSLSSLLISILDMINVKNFT